MNRLTTPLRQTAAVLCTAALALVAACGGGGSSTPTTPGTPSVTATNYSQGPIAGFGSVIVNGVRWDDSSATVTDDDGVAHKSGDLKLGMVVEVDGSGVDHAAGTGKAMHIRFGSETKGPISSIDPATSTFTVLGITIEVTTSTVFDASIGGGLAGLKLNDVVEIHGLFDAANDKVVATRVEPEAGATEYRMRGVVKSLDTLGKTFMLGSEKISYGSLAAAPTGLANDVQVKVRLQTTQVAGAWVATKVRPIGTSMEDRAEAEVEGSITAFRTTTDFDVNGLKVDASGATMPADPTVLKLGAHVEVKGSVKDGVLIATSVKVDDDGHHGGGGGGDGGPAREFELHGAISGLSTEAKTFALRGMTVNYGGAAVVFKGGSVTNLANDVKVEVKGVLSADLSHIDATLVKFED